MKKFKDNNCVYITYTYGHTLQNVTSFEVLQTLMVPADFILGMDSMHD